MDIRYIQHRNEIDFQVFWGVLHQFIFSFILFKSHYFWGCNLKTLFSCCFLLKTFYMNCTILHKIQKFTIKYIFNITQHLSRGGLFIYFKSYKRNAGFPSSFEFFKKVFEHAVKQIRLYIVNFAWQMMNINKCQYWEIRTEENDTEKENLLTMSLKANRRRCCAQQQTREGKVTRQVAHCLYFLYV